MAFVTFLTGDHLPIPDEGTPLVAQALADRGIDSRTITWSDRDAMAVPSDLIVITTAWDYTEATDAFLTALRTAPGTVANPVGVVTWNMHKGYLVTLADAGVPVVPTRLISRGSPVDLGVGEIIVKPAIASGARGVGRYDAADPAAAAHLTELLRHGDALVQPFQPAVSDGERSLMFLGGRFSHAIRKVPAAADFRVQVEHGGLNSVHLPSADELRVAEAALAQVDADLLYARVDLIPGPDGPLLMELELIEPELFLSFAPHAAGQFADAIAARLG